jgi:hypothetical protein
MFVVITHFFTLKKEMSDSDSDSTDYEYLVGGEAEAEAVGESDVESEEQTQSIDETLSTQEKPILYSKETENYNSKLKKIYNLSGDVIKKKTHLKLEENKLNENNIKEKILSFFDLNKSTQGKNYIKKINLLNNKILLKSFKFFLFERLDKFQNEQEFANIVRYLLFLKELKKLF